MKVRKAVSGIAFGLGCSLVFVGLLALILPSIQNDQLRLVLSSFSMPSENLLVNGMNAAMTYALGNCYLVMLIGAAFMLAGALLMFMQEKREAARQRFVRDTVNPLHEPVAFSAASGNEWPDDLPPRATENPFADYTLGDMLKPREEATNCNPFAAPSVCADESTQAFATRSAAQDHSAYERPAGTPKPPLPAHEELQEAFAEVESPKLRQAEHDQVPIPPAPTAFEQPHAVDTQAQARSQSGSRAIVRSTFSTKAPPVAQEPPASTPVLDDPSAPKELPVEQTTGCEPVSPRIRSTMGKHT